MKLVKGIKGHFKEIKNRDKATNNLFSTAVFRIRLHIESLFNWLIQNTDIRKLVN
jgi:hypothetical protein